jgi:hypothetical protein
MSDIPPLLVGDGLAEARAGAEKIALERQKLDLEINRLKHFWRDPDFWIKVSTLLVGVATVWGAVWFSFLGADVHRLQNDKETLTNETKVLESDKTRLTNTKNDLEKDKIALTTDKTALTAEVGNLQSKIATDTLSLLIDLLRRQFAPPETVADAMERERFLSGPAGSLVKMLRNDSVNRKQSVREIDKVLSATPSSPLKAELLIILAEGTHDYRWKTQIKREFLDLVRPGIDWGAFSQGAPQEERFAALLLLEELHTWDQADQLSVCSSLIAGLDLDRKLPAARKLLILKTVFEVILFPPFSLQTLSKDSLDVTLRGFAIARDISTSDKESDDDRLEAMHFISRLSHEAAVAVVATVLADSDTSDGLRFDLDEFRFIFPRVAKAPKDDDATHWGKWVSEHDDLVEPYMEDDLSKLKQSISQARHDQKVKKM